MTTHAWSSPIRHDSDAAFRAWGLELSGKFALIGLTKTTDTGQIDWATVVRPGSYIDAGYEIWRFNDPMQGTAPIFLRIGYGSSSPTARLTVQVGTGSNGAGTLTGTALTASVEINGYNSPGTDTIRSSYMCYLPGVFWFAWKHGTVNAWFFITRSCDSSGAPTATGAIVGWGISINNAIKTQALRFAAPATAFGMQTSPTYAFFGFLPQTQANSLNSAGQIQAAMGWMWLPDVAPMFSAVGIRYSDISEYATFTCTPVGATPRTFIALPTDFAFFSNAGIGTLTASTRFCAIWE